MKTKLVLLQALVTLFGFASQANTVESVYQIDSPLSLALKTAILNHLQTECSGGITDFGLSERQTIQTSSINTESGVINYYSTEFSSRVYDTDGYHPSQRTILVNSRETKSNSTASSKVEILAFDGICTTN